MVAREPVLLGVVRKPAVAKTAQTTKCAQPKIAGAIFMDHLHCSFDQSIFQLVADELAGLKPTEATERSDPKCAFVVLIDTRDVCIGQAIIHRVMSKLTIIEAVQTVILCSYPHVTFSIFVNGGEALSW